MSFFQFDAKTSKTKTKIQNEKTLLINSNKKIIHMFWCLEGCMCEVPALECVCVCVPVGSGPAKSFINIYAHFSNTHYESVPFHGNILPNHVRFHSVSPLMLPTSFLSGSYSEWNGWFILRF